MPIIWEEDIEDEDEEEDRYDISYLEGSPLEVSPLVKKAAKEEEEEDRYDISYHQDSAYEELILCEMKIRA
jgi:hypothetical protein